MHHAYAALVLAAPSPGNSAPPGSAAFMTLLSWIGWGASIAGVAGFIAVAVGMMLSHRDGRGGTGEHGSRFAFVAAGCAIAAAAGPIVTALGL